MAKGYTIKNIPPSKMLAMYNAIKWLIQHYDVENPHEALLLLIAESLRDKFAKKLNNDQGKYTINFTEVEALAYYQIWSAVDLTLMNYEGLMMQSVVDEMDKHFKGLIAQKSE